MSHLGRRTKKEFVRTHIRAKCTCNVKKLAVKNLSTAANAASAKTNVFKTEQGGGVIFSCANSPFYI